MTMIPRNNRASGNLGVVLGICVFLAVITWLVFGQTLRHDFVWDDYGLFHNEEITKGLTLHGIAWAFGHSVLLNWHPLTTFTHMLDCQLYGLNPSGHHCTNVVLHTVVVVLLFLVLREMTGGPSRTGNVWRSAFVAAIFAVHPLRVESVAWVAERKDLLSGVFFMLTLAVYVRYVRRPSFAKYLLVALVFTLGLMSKPMLVTLPFVLLLLDYWPLRRFAAQASTTNNAKSLSWLDRQSTPRKLILEKVPLLVLSAISCGITLLVQWHAESSVVTLPLLLRLYNVFLSCVIYIWQMFLPTRLAIFYPYPSGQLSALVLAFAIALLVAITMSAWALRKQRPYFITGWLWYLAMLVPVIGLIQVGAQAHADRYTYLPHIGLYLLATWAIADLSTSWRHRRTILSTGAITAIAILTWGASIQTSYWKNNESIWTRTLAVTSNNAVAHEQIGILLLKRRQLDEGIFHFQESLRIRPDLSNVPSNPDNARARYYLARVHNYLGNALFEKGLVGEAMSHYQTALKLNPEFPEAHSTVAEVLFQQGDIDQAIAHWKQTLSIQPADAEVHASLGSALLRKRLVGEAIVHFEKSLAIAPQSVATLNNLAWVLSTCPEAPLRNGARAIELAEKADQLSERKNPAIIRTLAAAYAETGRFDDAINAAERALQLALAQGDSTLAGKLQSEVGLYRTNLPRRDRGLAKAQP